MEEITKQLTTNDQQLTTKLSGQTAQKRWLKENFYYRLPLFAEHFSISFIAIFSGLVFLTAKKV